jgi:hypothetical protein
VTLKTYLVRFYFCCIFSVLSCGQIWGQATLTQILNNGPSSNRINVVFFPDGYTASQLQKFLDTDAYVMMNSFFNNVPFNEYKSYYNVYAISVASNESGSDHPSRGIYRDTYFSSTFETAEIDRLLTLSGNGYMRADSLLQQFVPDYDLVVVVVNDPEYGGSGGGIAVTSLHSAAPEVVVHEMGHSFGYLNDEYDSYTPGYSGSEGPNTTAEIHRDAIKWRDWIFDTTPVPTPPTSDYLNDVGLFEGACYETQGWYRPKINCKMRALGYPFCEVCIQQLLLSQCSKLSLVDSSYPSIAPITLVNTQSATLGVVPLVPVSHVLSVRWYINGLCVPGESLATYSPTGREVGNGTSAITGTISDNSQLVKDDPGQYLQKSIQWSFNVTGVSFSPPLLASPEDGATSQPLTMTLRWHPMAGVASYRLQVASNSDFSETILFQKNVTDTVFEVSLANAGQYFWRVASEDNQGCSAYSPARHFVTVLTVPALVLPPDDAPDAILPIIFKWRHIEGALTYRFQVATDTLFLSIAKDTVIAADTILLVSDLEFLQKYFWHVKASNSAETTAYSPRWSFTTIYPWPPSPELVMPSNGSMSLVTPLTFRWNSSQRATQYNFTIAYDSNFTNIGISRTGIIDTSVQITSLDFNTEYYWHVEASNAAGTGPASSAWKFTTIQNSPILVRPLNGSIDQSLSLNLIWRPVKHAISYRVQLALDSLFSNIVLDDSTVLLTYKSLTDLNLATTYYWRVRSVDSLGDTTWSASFYRFKTVTVIAVSAVFNVMERWNLVSIPLTVANYALNSLFPNAESNAYRYSAGYSEESLLRNSIGYWVKFTEPQTITHEGFSRFTDTITVIEGWNLIGSISMPIAVSNVVSNTPGLVFSQFFGFSKKYIAVDSIRPGFGYWVKANMEGDIILASSSARNSKNLARIIPTAELPPSPPGGNIINESIPVVFKLEQNHPNPFNPSTNINYQLPCDCNVSLEIYDIVGKAVSLLDEIEQAAGFKSLQWNAVNYPSGVYLYRLDATSISDPSKHFSQTKKMILIK